EGKQMSVQQTSEMVGADGVRKVYGEGPHALEALRSVSFSVETGQFVSILGPSGCGKSKLLNMVAGLDHPSAGTVRIQNDPVVVPRREIGIVFQDAVLLPWKTALENVLFPIRIMKLPLADYEPRARELLEAVGLAALWGIVRVSYRAVCGSVSPSAVGWCMTLKCFSWTSRSARSTPLPA